MPAADPNTVKQAGRSPGGKQGDTSADSPSGDFVPPFPKSAITDDQRTDMGKDWNVKQGALIRAIGDGSVTWTNGGGFGPYWLFLTLDRPVSRPLKDCGKIIYYGHQTSLVSGIHKGSKVKAGDPLFRTGMGTEGGMGHVEIGWAAKVGQTVDSAHGTVTPSHDNCPGGKDFTSFINEVYKGGTNFPAGSGGGSGGTGGGGANEESVAKAAAFSTMINLPGVLDIEESMLLTGDKALMNDVPLLPFIEQLCQASLRNFMSMPNGDFFAFFPDYFGGLSHRSPYWEIDDIEVIDGRIDLSDDYLSTHVYTVGDVAVWDGQIDIFDKVNSKGVITIFDAFTTDFLTGLSDPQAIANAKKDQEERNQSASKSQEPQTTQDPKGKNQAVTPIKGADGTTITPFANDKDAAIKFLQKYGARPYVEEIPAIRSPLFEVFYAYQKFMLMWSKQFLTQFEFTFMPELFPGGIIAFPEHGIQCYIDEVEHSCSYESGFTTRANLSAPAALRDSSGNAIAGRRNNVHEGMVRAFSLGTEAPASGNAGSPTPKSKPKKKPTPDKGVG